MNKESSVPGTMPFRASPLGCKLCPGSGKNVAIELTKGARIDARNALWLGAM